MSMSTNDRTIRNILLSPSEIPVMQPKTLVKEALELMTEKRLGLACVLDDHKRLIGIFTDGDLRRLLLNSQKPVSALFADDIIIHARRSFTSVSKDTSVKEALSLLRKNEIFDLPVVDKRGKLEGVIHLHPALEELV
ncbi:MAG: CBS domain-containing protein [Pseudomonadota bacterium]|nr:CBS domain-containing protein [Pseudomonadota bacterium]